MDIEKLKEDIDKLGGPKNMLSWERTELYKDLLEHIRTVEAENEALLIAIKQARLRYGKGKYMKTLFRYLGTLIGNFLHGLEQGKAGK